MSSNKKKFTTAILTCGIVLNSIILPTYPNDMQTAQGKFKMWFEGTNPTYDSLRTRWSEEQISEVVKAIKTKQEVPDFVGYMPPLLNTYHLDGTAWRPIDLRGIRILVENFTYFPWFFPDFESADLSGTDFSFSHLPQANFKEAILEESKFQQSRLTGANFEGAYLLKADFKSANLSGANLSNAVLKYTDVSGADFYHTRLDSTYIFQTNIESGRNVRYILWGDSTKHSYYVGEEVAADYISDQNDTIAVEEYQIAKLVYRDLENLYKRELMLEVAQEFNFRANEVETKMYATYNPVKWLRVVFLKLSYGYGNRPLWFFCYSGVIVLLFFLIFSAITLSKSLRSGVYHLGKSKRGDILTRTNWRFQSVIIDCFWFSLLSFVTFGYGAIKPSQWLQLFRSKPVTFKSIGVVRILAGIEAILGVWTIALLVYWLAAKT